ncbi:glycosyltransferase family 2 protein [Quadrisphaera oryzae]|uniref:glycosyltransferase family 2 protein n=1 Tax=Quadrisphaera TaxID=317661 RepID=UPI001648D0CC|nr:glycosyltransferase [Quadrisphaera sp. RL12-1S]
MADSGRPRVSVCMPAHRDSHYLREALDSVLAQTEADLEVVVTDNSGGALRPAVEAAADPRVRYSANERNLGMADNHCRAIDTSTGDHVAFMHDDDGWDPGYLRSAVQVLDADPTVGVVITGALEIDEEGRPLGRRPSHLVPGPQPDSVAALLTRAEQMILPTAAVFRREALAANTRPWPQVDAADLTMFLDAARAGWRVHYVESPLVRYRIHSGQIVGDEIAHRTALVTVWDRYTFPDPRHESARRQLLARCLVARAGAYVRKSRTADARRDLVRAVRTDRAALRPRTAVLLVLSVLPQPAIALAHRVWHRFYDPSAHRHEM